MLLTRIDTNATLVLPDDFHWVDQDWTPVVQNAEYSLTGALILEYATKQAGRPMTLQPGQEGGSTFSQTDAFLIAAWSRVPALELTLQRFNRLYHVVWNHTAKAVELSPYLFWVNTTSDPANDPRWVVTVRFFILSES